MIFYELCIKFFIIYLENSPEIENRTVYFFGICLKSLFARFF